MPPPTTVNETGADEGPGPALFTPVTVTLKVPVVPGGSGITVETVAVDNVPRIGPLVV